MRTPLRGIGPPGDNEVFALITEDDHHYAMWDAAYVLGSLSASDRREFEGHMAGCPACREAVADECGIEVTPTTDRLFSFAIRAMSRTTGLIPEWLKRIRVSAGSRRWPSRIARP